MPHAPKPPPNKAACTFNRPAVAAHFAIFHKVQAALTAYPKQPAPCFQLPPSLNKDSP
ncbi:hypothetical protein [Kingella denitrificans]